jgi:hypothetical protein
MDSKARRYGANRSDSMIEVPNFYQIYTAVTLCACRRTKVTVLLASSNRAVAILDRTSSSAASKRTDSDYWGIEHRSDTPRAEYTPIVYTQTGSSESTRGITPQFTFFVRVQRSP